MTRLDTIVHRERKLRTHDLAFALLIALIAILAVATIGMALDNAPVFGR